MSISWQMPYPQVYLGAKVAVDDHSAVVQASALPLFDFDIELYFAKNYHVKRGIFVSLNMLGLNIESNPGPGEKTWDDEDPGASS